MIALWLSLLGCKDSKDSGELDLGPDPETLPIPDLEGVDLAATSQDALNLAVGVDFRAAWAAHVLALTNNSAEGCPDLYTGNPDVEDDNIDIDEDATGLSWYDYCQTDSGALWGGVGYWESEYHNNGDVWSEVGESTDASRYLFADGVVGQGDDVLFEFDGEGSDSLSRTDYDDGANWTYSSIVEGTVSGRLAFDPDTAATPGGYRTDLYISYSGGEENRLEVRGNIYLPDDRIQGRFDSVAVDMTWAAPDSIGPDDCAEEPSGWIAVRDENAFWYDMVFAPKYTEDDTDSGYANEPYTDCDGCGSVYVRGLEQDPLEVCPDFSFLWNGTTLLPPDPEDFIFVIRDVE